MSGYLDHASTTPVRPEVLEAMLPYFSDKFANPSGAHKEARAARRAIDDARDVIAAAVGALPAEVVFTSGGTEADNLAVFGVHGAAGGTVLCSAIEHHAILDSTLSVGGRTVPVGASGSVDLDALGEILDRAPTPGAVLDRAPTPGAVLDRAPVPGAVSLVSVMMVNNEVGVINPIPEVARVIRKRAPSALLHTDAIQALCWLDVAEHAADADLISLSAHKVGGPKGVGALIVRGDEPIQARQVGGGQERGIRSGTQNVPGIVGFAAAVEATVRDRAETAERCRRLRDRLVDGLVSSVDGLMETGGGDRSGRVPGIAHVCISGIESEALIFLLEERGVLVSAGSSCSSGALEPSHVLAAMGVGGDWIGGPLRISLGRDSTDADVDLALEAVPPAVERLRLFA